MKRKICVLGKVEDKINDINYLEIFDINFISQSFDISQYDALIFTSKNAVYSLESYSDKIKNIPAYAISNKTAKTLTDNNFNLEYTSKCKNGNDFANDIKIKLKNKKVLYIRAKTVVSNLVNILQSNNVLCDEIITYETTCKTYTKNFKPCSNSIIIFSSPSSIKCFLKNFSWDDSYTAIAIGKTTAGFLPKELKCHISKDTSIDSCIELARTFN